MKTFTDTIPENVAARLPIVSSPLIYMHVYSVPTVFRYLADRYLSQVNMVIETDTILPQKIGPSKSVL